MADKNPILSGVDIRLNWDKGDPWGSAMRVEFAIADILALWEPKAIPAEWEYRPSPFLSTSHLVYDEVSGEGSAEELVLDLIGLHILNGEFIGRKSDRDKATERLVFAGTVLHRLIRLYVANGLDY